ncbi:hypothetical protein [Streptomyces griseoaurantiacus]|uniref:hypothetical protein n=1 Tax=Streptomyces griseoaurantiacus TaxID=68213 RepID=UPI002E2B90C6|nr:hypothetical protein [Streptomyces jietaisiensis]
MTRKQAGSKHFVDHLRGNPESEIADVLGIAVGDVENARYRLRSQVRTRRRNGEPHAPPGVEAEWARTRAQAKTKKKAA